MFNNTYTDIIVNFLPINFTSETFEGYVIPFVEKEHLHKIRQKHQNILFHRDGNNIYCVPVSDDVSFDGEKRKFNVYENQFLVSHMVRECFRRHFVEKKKYPILRIVPLQFVNINKNLLPDLLAKKGLGIYSKFSINAEYMFTKKGEPICGLAIDISTFYDISISLEKLIESGYNVKGIYVVSKENIELGTITLYKNKLQGRIDSIENDHAKLLDFREKRQIEICKAFPEASRANFQNIAAHIIRNEKYQLTADAISKAAFKIHSAEAKLDMLNKIKSTIKKYEPLECVSNLKFRCSDTFVSESSDIISVRKYKRPIFVFDPPKNKTSNWQDKGLNDYGPFDSESFTKKKPKIVVVVPDKYKGEVETFISSFKNGLARTERFKRGFIRKYHLSDFEKIDFILIQTDNSGDIAEKYRDSCINALEQNSYDLALIIIEESFHRLNGNQNPYLITKSIFMSQGIPVQEVEIETIRNHPSLPYTLNNFSLACYAKLGGIPWTISSIQPIAHELVIGLGCAIIKEGRLSKSERYVGITSVFSADGNYLLSNFSKEVTYDEYENELLKSLKLCVNEVSKRNAWQKGDNVRLVFHQTFKKFKNKEIAVIKRCIGEIADFDVEYSFLCINRQHPFILFDNKNTGKKSTFERKKYSKLSKGKYVPERGHMFKIKPHEVILTLTGPYQLRTSFDPCPKPIIVTLHHDSTFKDIDYLCRQIYEFTFLSWRSFNPTTVPVTILYSDLIARLLGLLRGVKNWNPDMLSTQLRSSRWFL